MVVEGPSHRRLRRRVGQLSHAFLFDRVLGTRPAFRPTIDISMDPATSCQALLHHHQPHNLQTASGNDFVQVCKKFEHEATDPYSCGNRPCAMRERAGSPDYSTIGKTQFLFKTRDNSREFQQQRVHECSQNRRLSKADSIRIPCGQPF